MSWDRSKGRPEPIAALNRVTERENGEPLVDLREASAAVKVLRPGVIPYARKTVAEMVEAAAHRLPDGMHLGLVEAWRPIDRQKRIYEWMRDCLLEVKPEASKAELRRRVNRFVAPYDQKAPPGHCTGGALDIHLLDARGRPVDVTSPLPRLHANPTYAYGLSETALRNRMALVEAMLAAGFSNCRDEWWHYSYGDAAWAVREGRAECCYGLVELEPSLYEEQAWIWEEGFKERTNPYLEAQKGLRAKRS